MSAAEGRSSGAGRGPRDAAESASGSAPPFDKVFEENWNRICGYLFGMTQDPSAAEELAQETFIKVQRGLSTFRGDSSLSTWLYQIATNTLRDQFKSRSARETRSSVSLEDKEEMRARLTDFSTVRPDVAAAQAEMSGCVQRYVLKLAPTCRTPLVPHDMQELSNPEIAEILGVPVSTVKMRIHRARARLKEALDAGCAFEHDERNVFVCEPEDEREDDGAARPTGGSI